MDMELRLDEINQRAWTTRDAFREFTREKKWTDPGEASAFAWVTDECRGQPLLDIGVGAGRTIPMMMQISFTYTGIDYTASLLDQSRKFFPGLDLRRMDARDMSALPSNRYALSAFSWNGIDCVDYEDRERILEEMHRVTRPGGLVLFSTHNRGGPGFDERPLQLLPQFSGNPLRFGWRVVRALRHLPVAFCNYRRHAPLHRDDEGYSIRSAAEHRFGTVIVYTTLTEQRRQLGALGFEVEAVFGSSDGKLIAPETQSSDAGWLHFIARKVR
jgi:SAM-dependent methyltransferase